MGVARSVLAVVAVSVFAEAAAAQAPAGTSRTDPPVLLSGSFGIGAATHGFGGRLSLGLGTTGGEFVLRTAAAEDLNIFGPVTSSEDVALLYGRRVRGGRGWVRFAAGPGFAHSERPGDAQSCYLFFCEYGKIVSNDLGLGLQVDAVWAPSRWFGIGLGAFGNVNSGTSFVGATANLHLGRLR